MFTKFTIYFQPPSSLATIQGRQECVEEFLANEQMFFDVVASLKQFVDLDHLLANLVQVPAKNSLVSARAIQSAIANIVRE